MPQGRLGVFELFLAAQVAVFENQATGLGEVVLRGLPRVRRIAKEEPRAIQMDVGQEQRHRPALGDLPRFVQIALRALGAGARTGETAQPGAGEKAAGEVVLHAGAAEAGHGVVQLRRCSGESALTLLGRVRGRGLRCLTLAAPRFDNSVERGAAQREMVEADGEEGGVAFLGPLERLRRTLGDGSAQGKPFVVLRFSFRLPAAVFACGLPLLRPALV